MGKNLATHSSQFEFYTHKSWKKSKERSTYIYTHITHIEKYFLKKRKTWFSWVPSFSRFCKTCLKKNMSAHFRLSRHWVTKSSCMQCTLSHPIYSGVESACRFSSLMLPILVRLTIAMMKPWGGKDLFCSQFHEKVHHKRSGDGNTPRQRPGGRNWNRVHCCETMILPCKELFLVLV